LFKKLANFKYKRSFSEAIGFYLVYLVLALVLGASVGALGGIVFYLNSMTVARIAIFISMIYCFSLGYSILKAKKLTKDAGSIIICLLAGVLAPIGGAILGLIPVAYLSSK
jgi:hypothetical protein